ncbi:DUF167 domain-containing protein [bacterium]|jgi:uncharacterized protein|nr:DUF167 domain-containing protein [bacterium]
MALTFEITVTPRAAKNRWKLDDNGVLRCYVTAPPVDGKANKAVIDALAKALKLPKSSVKIVSGGLSRRKRISIDVDFSHDEILQLLGLCRQTKIF